MTATIPYFYANITIFYDGSIDLFITFKGKSEQVPRSLHCHPNQNSSIVQGNVALTHRSLEFEGFRLCTWHEKLAIV